MANIEINIKENGTTTLATAGKYCDRNIDVVTDVPIPEGYIKPEGSVEITENGTYDVTEQAQAVVNVPTGGGDELAESLLRRTITELSDDTLSILGAYALAYCPVTKVHLTNCYQVGAYALYNCTALTDVYIRHEIGTSYAANAFNGCTSLERIDLLLSVASTGGLASTFRNCSSLRTVIIRNDYVPNLTNTLTFQSTPIESGTGYVYVPDELVDSYKTATNWITFASQIKPISELEE